MKKSLLSIVTVAMLVGCTSKAPEPVKLDDESAIKTVNQGLVEKRITRMRPGTLGICAAIQHKYNVDTVPHVLCGGFTKEETEGLKEFVGEQERLKIEAKIDKRLEKYGSN